MDTQNKIKSNREIANDIIRGIFTAAGAVAEIYAIALLFGLAVSPVFILILISGSISIYLFDFLRESKVPSSSESESYKEKFRPLYILPLSLALFFAALIIIYGNIPSIIFAGALLIYGLIYDPVTKSLTKYLPAFKDLYVALGWTLMPALFFLFHSYNFSIAASIFLLFVLSRDFVNVSFCDLKDLISDKYRGLKTVAVESGSNSTFKILQVINLLSVGILILGVIFGDLPSLSLALIIPVVIMISLFGWAKASRNYSPYIVDSEYFLWFVVILIFTKYVAIF
ncbi:hypothetical protein A2215_02780 [Candidatus Berkelbacteria bacterium RIFOXYA2_FULL_43_10]|uniref:Prenyltransferase n=1 Tax=Candidatus Berkelbacteria bacterium RIFOXYA2_FULL_43_10 TaxID=1797472 RepID=A0A1F5E8W8_9BACT|nr:MAG: hypothetical protein A2215_02780 [Candidatus Berkelbacteria bacterium RIFOXYA2_FULL_43_10]